MNFFKKTAVVVLATAATVPAYAAIDLSPLTSSIDATTVITALMAIGVVLGGIAVAKMGIQKVISFIK